MQQFTHPVHPKSSYRLRTCFGGKAGKIRNTGSRQKKCKWKETKQSKKTVQRTEYTGKQFSFQKLIASQQPPPIKWLVLLSSPSCRPSLLLLLRRTHELLANSCLLSSCSNSFFFVVVYPDVLLMKQRRLLLRACKVLIKKPSVLASRGNKLSSVCGESASIAGDTSGLCSPVPIADDFGGVSSSSDLVTTAACRGDKSHSDAVLYFPARCSPMTLSGCTETCGTERSTGGTYSEFKIIFNDAGNMPFCALLSLF